MAEKDGVGMWSLVSALYHEEEGCTTTKRMGQIGIQIGTDTEQKELK